MEIDEIEIHEFTYRLDDVGTDDGHQVYSPGDTLSPPGYVLTIRTDTGLEGHYRGFMYTPPGLTQVEMAAREFLLGENPLNREEIWRDLWKAFRHTDHFGMGPVDIALWDIAGKHYGESVSKLLGGYKSSVPAYASTYWGDSAEGGLSTPEAYASFAEDCLEAGYPGFKIHPKGDPETDIEICRAVGDAVGDDMDLMLDPASSYTTFADARRVGRALDELDFFWYEDPHSDTGQSQYMAGKLTEELATPVLGVEHVRGVHYSRANHIRSKALDLVRGDAHLDGGITGVMKIASLADAFGLDVELHVGGPAHLHCMSAIHNTNYFEHGLLHPEVDWMSNQGFVADVEVIDSDGRVDVPDGPGLGVEIDWGFVEERQTDYTHVTESGVSGLS